MFVDAAQTGATGFHSDEVLEPKTTAEGWKLVGATPTSKEKSTSVRYSKASMGMNKVRYTQEIIAHTCKNVEDFKI